MPEPTEPKKFDLIKEREVIMGKLNMFRQEVDNLKGLELVMNGALTDKSEALVGQVGQALDKLTQEVREFNVLQSQLENESED